MGPYRNFKEVLENHSRLTVAVQSIRGLKNSPSERAISLIKNLKKLCHRISLCIFTTPWPKIEFSFLAAILKNDRFAKPRKDRPIKRYCPSRKWRQFAHFNPLCARLWHWRMWRHFSAHFLLLADSQIPKRKEVPPHSHKEMFLVCEQKKKKVDEGWATSMKKALHQGEEKNRKKLLRSGGEKSQN